MLLCDIGNTSYHFLKGDYDYKKSTLDFDPSVIKEKVFYICVNNKLKKKLDRLENWVDISVHVDMKNYYNTMGIDRIFACEAIENGLIIDAGSAITVDIVRDGVFEGGFIYPGINAMSKTYENISTALDLPFNFDIDLNTLPKNSIDSISYGYLKTFYLEVMSHDMQIYLTGGDAKKFSTLFTDAKIEQRVIFDGMKKVIKLG